MNTISELITDIKAGKIVIILDDDNRENEGDLIMAAEKITPTAINFMITYARGLCCLPLRETIAKKLQLCPMIQNNKSRYQTNFTASIEAAHGVETGISPFDRATTILTAIADNATPEDIISPGHVFPIIAKNGGVLERPGHTEAACDLAELAGYKPAGVLIEIINANGTMARRPDCENFSKQHGLKIGTIADLITYRKSH